jgi:hypothetical protein
LAKTKRFKKIDAWLLFASPGNAFGRHIFVRIFLHWLRHHSIKLDCSERSFAH